MMKKTNTLHLILAVIVGLSIGIIIISSIESFAPKLFENSESYILSADSDDTSLAFRHLTTPLLMFVLLAYGLGAFFGGFVSSIIENGILSALITGLLLMAGGIINLALMQHPLWFTITSLLIYVPLAIAGGKSGRFFRLKIKPNQTNQ
ncbi:MAG: hypothetical protein KG029_06875 [Bacteroidetes bacterium]|nr:hypothetical protein [Bacteroidota bacterium]